MHRNSQRIPYAPLILFDGTINGIPCTILKDDGASTNILSKSFYNQHKNSFETMKENISVSHSAQDSIEKCCEVTEPSIVKIRNHEYESKFVLADIRYDVILGTPWHKDVEPHLSLIHI